MWAQYRYAKLWFLSHSGQKWSIDFGNFGHKLGTVFALKS